MEPRVQFKLKEVGKFVGARCVGWVVMFKKIAVTVSAVSLLMLAVALAPGVPTVLARVGATTAINDAKLNEPLAQQSCEAFENWFRRFRIKQLTQLQAGNKILIHLRCVIWTNN